MSQMPLASDAENPSIDYGDACLVEELCSPLLCQSIQVFTQNLISFLSFSKRSSTAHSKLKRSKRIKRA